MRLVFDLETDGYLEHLTKIHCIAIRNADDTSQSWVYSPQWIEQGLKQLMEADEVIGHNIITFDIPAAQKVYPWFDLTGVKVTDTLVLSRLMRPDLKQDDYQSRMTAKEFPKKHFGSHSLKAWGLRLGIHKGDFGEQTDWSEWSQGMQDYCERDVEVNVALWEALAPHTWSQQSIEFEHRIAELCHRIGQAGWTFDEKGAEALLVDLSSQRADLEAELQTLFPNWEIEEEFIPKVNNSKLGYVKANPSSSARKSSSTRTAGSMSSFACGRSTTGSQRSSPCKVTPRSTRRHLGHCHTQKHRSWHVRSCFRSGWASCQTGRTAGCASSTTTANSHTINPNGTVTGRASSFGPNLQQVPSLRSEYGEECRDLFRPADGYTLVGADLSGLELRCLAHFLKDNGAYAKEVVEGDVPHRQHEGGWPQDP